MMRSRKRYRGGSGLRGAAGAGGASRSATPDGFPAEDSLAAYPEGLLTAPAQVDRIPLTARLA